MAWTVPRGSCIRSLCQAARCPLTALYIGTIPARTPWHERPTAADWQTHPRPSAASPEPTRVWPIRRSRRVCTAASGTEAPLSEADQPLTDKEQLIAARIAAARARRKARAFIHCVACGIGVASPLALQRHMNNCCPDIVDQDRWQQMLDGLPCRPTGPAPPDYAPLTSLLQDAEAHEERQRAAALDIAFRSGERDAEGQLVRHGPAVIAKRLGLSEPRAKRLLSAAMRAVPLVADPDPLDICWECDDFLAVNKPPRVQTAPVHRFKGGSMVNRTLHYLQPKGLEPRVLHRLDMDTSGVLLFAKSAGVVSGVHQQFRRRQVKKMYVAVAEGVPDVSAWESHGSIGPHPAVKVARLVREADSTSRDSVESMSITESDSELSDSDSMSSETKATWQAAHTSFVVVSVNKDASLTNAVPGSVYQGTPRTQGVCLLAAAPHTGRTHQIRVHAQAAGHPLLGDELYGLQLPLIPRQALHAWQVSITHPTTGQPLTARAPLADDVQQLLESVGLWTHDIEDKLEAAWQQLHG